MQDDHRWREHRNSRINKDGEEVEPKGETKIPYQPARVHNHDRFIVQSKRA